MNFGVTPLTTASMVSLHGQPFLDQKLSEARQIAHLLPSGSLLSHTDSLYNLGISPGLPPLSDEVRWQIYFATYSYKDLFGNIHLSDNFSVEHLNPNELAILFKILHSYHKVEIATKGAANAIFHAHLTVLENKFISLCRTNVIEGRKLLEIIMSLYILNIDPLLNKLSKTLGEAKTHTPSKEFVQTRLLEARSLADWLPSGLLIRLADNYFNLMDDPQYPILSDAVKWQIVHAASAYKNKDTKVIHLSDNFSIESLSYPDLAVLYRIFLSYHSLEKQVKGQEKAVFQKHLFIIEARFEAACFNNPLEGYEAIRSLEQIGDPSFGPLLQTLKKILEKKGNYPVFVEDPVVTTLCSFLEPAQIREFLSSQGLVKTREMAHHLQNNCGRLFIWLNEFSLVEAMEGDPTMQKVALRWKSRVEERLFQRYMDLITRIGEGYPILFNGKFSLSHNLALRPEGMSLMVDYFKAKGSFVGNTSICDNYDVYKEGLRNISCAPDGEWYFVIRTHKVRWTFDSDHEALVFAEKKQGQFYIHIFDSGPFKMHLAGHQLTDETKSVLPYAHIYSTLVPRQRDFFNCGIYVLNDMKAISRNKDTLIQWLRNNAERAEKHLPQGAPASIRDVLVTKDVPIDLLKPAQSISQLKEGLAKPVIPDTSGKGNKIRELMRIFHALELSEDKSNFGAPIFAYAKFKGLKYRIRILNETFGKITALA